MGLDIEKMYEAVDAADIDGFCSFLADDIVLKFGNAPKMHGVAEIKSSLEVTYQGIRGVKHTVQKVLSADDHIFITCDVQYTRHDGSTLDVPAAVLLRHSAKGIHEYLIYVDSSAL